MTFKLQKKRGFCREVLVFSIFLALSSLMAIHFVLLHNITANSSVATGPSSVLTNLQVTRAENPPLLFSSKSNTGRSPMISPLWTCSDPKAVQNGRTTKLVFVHVFKTAGMTMRELFLRYAVACNAGMGLVSECSGLKTTSNSSVWRNGFGSKKGKPCFMKALNRTQQSITLPTKQIETSLIAELDILGGHLPLGVGAIWGNAANRSPPPRIQYVTFFRNAIDKFVSGIMYQKKDQSFSFEAIVELIQKRVKGELRQGKYREGYSAYLLTPQQKERYYSLDGQQLPNSSVQGRTQQILENLDQENVLVGIVERMSESLELLNFLIDSDQEQAALFQSFGMKPRGQSTSNADEELSASTSPKKNNPSKFSTSSVVAELQKDEVFWDLLSEYVKYDDAVYRHALQIHESQYQSLTRTEQLKH